MTLAGSYKPLADRFRTQTTPYTIWDIFDCVLAQYAAFDTSTKPPKAPSKAKTGSSTKQRACPICKSTNHGVNRCPQVTSSAAGKASASTPPKAATSGQGARKPSKGKSNNSVKRAHNVNVPVTSINSEISRHLRPSSRPKE